jgi:dephospho-CoA kinase
LGGVAAGKSTVAAAFARHGLLHVDADALARAVIQQPAVAAAIVAAFGKGAFAADGSLDRPALAAQVFSDAAKKRQLEAITHPPIRAAILADLQAAKAAGRSVLLDVPLLFENGLIEQCDATVFVEAPPAVRQSRAAARGWSAGELERRQASQAPLALKRAKASHTIDNGASLEQTARQVALVLADLARRP